jgi:fructokinase
VVCLGEVLIDLVAVDPDAAIQTATTFRKAPGGAPANVAVGVARLGIPSGFIGKVSDDAFGQFLRATLEREGVDVRSVVVDPTARTPLAFVGAAPGGGRAWIFYHRGLADTTLRWDELDSDLIDGAEVFHFGSVTLAAEPGRSTTLAAARVARDHGRLVSFDPNVRLELWDDGDDALRSIREAMPLADVLKVSSDEIAFLTGFDDPARAASRLRSAGPRLVVVTLGAAGTYIQLGSFEDHVSTPRVAAVDPTGAGDAFVAALLSRLLELPGLVEGRDPASLIEAVRFANAAGALATTQLGAIPSLPTAAAVKALLERETGRMMPEPRIRLADGDA